MKYKQIILCLLVLIGMVQPSWALGDSDEYGDDWDLDIAPGVALQPQRSVAHGQDFLLSRALVVRGGDRQVELERLIKESGGMIERGFFRKFSTPKVIIRHSDKIEGARGANGLKIEVTTKRVLINYTTAESLERAMALLREAVVKRNGRFVIKGTDIVDWRDNINGQRRRTGNLDLTAGTSLLPKTQIDAIVGRSRSGDEIELRVVSPTGWVIESRTLDGINPNHKIYSAVGHYTLAQLQAINNMASSRGAEIILKADFLTENAAFEKVTGFKFNSVEGMRFVRALLTEWTTHTGVTKFSVGSSEDVSDERFLGFLDFLQEMLNITITRD